MKDVMLYGDSFFWGVDASSGSRHAFEDRIGVICQKQLGEGYNVVVEGLRGRTMFGENGWFPERDGLMQFGPIFASHLPLSVVVFMLGTNDLNTRTQHEPADIAESLLAYVEKMKFWCDFMKYELPNIVVVAPPEIDESSLTAFKEIFEGAAQNIEPLRESLKELCAQQNFTFIDAATIVKSQDTDGIHLSALENAKLGTALAEMIKSLLTTAES